MRTLHTVLTGVVGIILLFSNCESLATEPKAWVKLTDCQYVANAYNDGDSFHVRCDTNEFIVRLYFVDAPELDTKDRERLQEQTEYFKVTLENNLQAAVQARDAVDELLRAAPFVVWTRWASAAGRSKQPRYYGLVEVGEKGLAEMLVSRGLARTKGVRANLPSGEKSKVYVEKLHGLENEAKEKQVGIWAHSRVE